MSFFITFLGLSFFQISPEFVLTEGSKGDANSDGTIDGIDYVIWLNAYTKGTIRSVSIGDLDKSGVVDSEDYTLWLDNYASDFFPRSAFGDNPVVSNSSDFGVDLNSRGIASKPRVFGISTISPLALQKVRDRANFLLLSLTSRVSQFKRKLFPRSNIITFKEAREYVGQEKSVEGEIKEVLNNGKAVYLGFKKPHTGEFLVRILEGNWSKFDDTPDKLYHEGFRIRVTGVIEWYQGDPTIYVQDPSQIVILSGLVSIDEI